ncbi:glycosyltransferase [filamentous cyanobacterium LEGE 11480]|uniref:Glycosyltransferase n=1 Tax=Romeriopsis navalis LEGE 11480 TaxID=2777977 RepID=A0A928VIP5_9CYAN|nr:glycosyltransferase [Romeriopsis navalis]MBE9029055.1 glycosyltransferase [Romeriopsis navalis LEGE 11480]
MTHFGIICPPVTGHLNPMIALGYELKQRGHSVSLLGWEQHREMVEATGIHFVPILSPRQAPQPDQKITSSRRMRLRHKLHRLKQRLQPVDHQAYTQSNGISALRIALAAYQHWSAIALRAAPAVIKAKGIDVLLVSETSYGGSTVAEYMGIPFITICVGIPRHQSSAVPPYMTSWPYQLALWARIRNRLTYAWLDILQRRILRLLNRYRRDWNLVPYTTLTDSASPLASLACLPKAFDFPVSLPHNFYFTGPYINDICRKPVTFPFDQLSDKPLIYASTGTLSNQASVYRCIAAACDGLDIQLVISLGGKGRDVALSNLPGNPLVVDYAPQIELLKRASLVITHAGLNTILESLAQGVPMVAIPGVLDQPGAAARLERSGAGKFIALKQLNAKRLRKLIQEVLQDPTYKDQARQAQAVIQQSGGVKHAAAIIEDVLDLAHISV